MQKNIFLWGLLFLSQIIMVAPTYSEVAQPYKNCSTTGYDQNGCHGTMTSCIELTDRNGDGCYDHYKTWGRLSGEFNGSPVDIPIPISEGDYKFRGSDGGGYFNGNPKLDPNSNDIVYAVTYNPQFDPQDTTIEHREIQITFVDSTTLEIVGVFVKLQSDPVPLYTSYRLGGNAKFGLTEPNSKENSIKVKATVPLIITPNPSNDFIKISIQMDIDYLKLFGNNYDYLKIYNLNGEVVYEQNNLPLSELLNINIQMLPVGHYNVELKIGFLRGTSMFIINR